MPCLTIYPDAYVREVEQKAAMVEASLCAVLRAIENAGVSIFTKPTSSSSILVDWAEAGVSRKQLSAWWEDHKREDAERIEREKKAAVERRLRNSALSKLTVEERAVLGPEVDFSNGEE
jgi:hypothetical protein